MKFPILPFDCQAKKNQSPLQSFRFSGINIPEYSPVWTSDKTPSPAGRQSFHHPGYLDGNTLSYSDNLIDKPPSYQAGAIPTVKN
jgi:hypothetical protein